jgi:hypothetical protein
LDVRAPQYQHGFLRVRCDNCHFERTEDEDIIDRILAHLRDKEQNPLTLPLLTPQPRASPETLPFFVEKEPVFLGVQPARTPPKRDLAWTSACCRSGMVEYELKTDLRVYDSSDMGKLFARV